ncbi:MAG: hypothetical protein A2Y77_02650 [Planctomycetes bacterium RBG_13_62_9]|nr:MAG: hypothetical protein A2Y77_02650 [Planctomycetes bacterium RBG_13_62_9]
MTDNMQQMLKRLLVAIVFSIAFAYVESAVVVYLRAIFHPDGFTFPMRAFDLTAQGRRLLLTEIGREAATLVLILAAAWLFGANRQQRAAHLLIIFAVWDISYYVWLKVLVNWPATLADWDILFLIPVVWASPFVYPVLVSLIMFAFGAAILYRDARGWPLRVTWEDLFGWTAAATIIIVSFCLGGRRITEPDYADHFHPLLFAIGMIAGVLTCGRAMRRCPAQETALGPCDAT